MSAYCEQTDAYAWTPRGSISNPAQSVAITAATDIITWDGHALADDDPLTFRAESGGSMPSPLVAGTTYYAIRMTDSTFKVAATAGGSAIDLTTAGSNVLGIAQPPWTRWIEEESALIEGNCPSHVVPFSETPPIVRRMVSLRVAVRARMWGGNSTEPIQNEIDDALRMFTAWAKGQQIRGAIEPASAQVPQLYVGSSTVSTRTIP